MSKEFIAQKLKEYRKKNGVSINDVANRFGKSVKTIYAWETGRGQPDADTLIQLCLLYGISSFSILHEDIASNVTEDISLNKTEKNIISDFRSLSPKGQEYILQTIQMAKLQYSDDADEETPLKIVAKSKPSLPVILDDDDIKTT